MARRAAKAVDFTRLKLKLGAGDGLDVVGRHAAGVPAGDTNLVRRALAAVGRKAMVRLTKNIPPGAGLGGGSADAAAVLRWAVEESHMPV